MKKDYTDGEEGRGRVSHGSPALQHPLAPSPSSEGAENREGRGADFALRKDAEGEKGRKAAKLVKKWARQDIIKRDKDLMMKGRNFTRSVLAGAGVLAVFCAAAGLRAETGGFSLSVGANSGSLNWFESGQAVDLVKMAGLTEASTSTLLGIAAGALEVKDSLDGDDGQNEASDKNAVAQTGGESGTERFSATSDSVPVPMNQPEKSDRTGDAFRWNEAVVDSSLRGTRDSVNVQQSSGRDYDDMDAVDAIPRSQVQ